MCSNNPVCTYPQRSATPSCDWKCNGIQDIGSCRRYGRDNFRPNYSGSLCDLTKDCHYPRNLCDITKDCRYPRNLCDITKDCRYPRNLCDITKACHYPRNLCDITKACRYPKCCQDCFINCGCTPTCKTPTKKAKHRSRSRKARPPADSGGRVILPEGCVVRQLTSCDENEDCPPRRPNKCGRRQSYPTDNAPHERRTPPPEDGDWEPGVDPYNATTAGYLGTHRPTMLENYLLRRPEFGKRPLQCPKLRPEDFRYGAFQTGKRETIKDVFSWPKKPEKLPPARPMDFLNLNRAAVSSGATGTKEQTDFRRAHCLRRLPTPEPPPQSLCHPAVFGSPSGFHDCMYVLLSDKPRNDWIRQEKVCQRLERNTDKERQFLTLKNRDENKASKLRLIANTPKIEKEKLWQMSKFQKVKPAISTFRKKCKC